MGFLNFYHVLSSCFAFFFFLWLVVCFFFFKQKTAYEMRISDWSSDVCSSDLVLRASDGATAEGVVETGADGTRLRLPIVVELLATVHGPDSAPAGSDVRVSWTGPDEDRDYIAIADPGASGPIHYTYTKAGNPLLVTLPDAVGSPELRYISRKTRYVLARQAIETPPVQATTEVPATTGAGSNLQVAWSRPAY